MVARENGGKKPSSLPNFSLEPMHGSSIGLCYGYVVVVISFFKIVDESPAWLMSVVRFGTKISLTLEDSIAR